jgi:hypothetical protein
LITALPASISVGFFSMIVEHKCVLVE